MDIDSPVYFVLVLVQTSVELDAVRPYHLGQAPGVGFDQRAGLGGRGAQGFDAELGEALALTHTRAVTEGAIQGMAEEVRRDYAGPVSVAEDMGEYEV